MFPIDVSATARLEFGVQGFAFRVVPLLFTNGPNLKKTLRIYPELELQPLISNLQLPDKHTRAAKCQGLREDADNLEPNHDPIVESHYV